MVEIPRVRPVGAPNLPERVRPRLSIDLGAIVPSAQRQAAREGQRAAQVNAETALVAQRTGLQNIQFGDQILEPARKLARAKITLQANDKAIQAILDTETQIQALQSAGTPTEELVPRSRELMEQRYQQAIADTASLGPEAQQFVARRLQQAGLSTLRSVQGKAFQLGVEERLGELDRLVTHTQRAFFATNSPTERLAITRDLLAAIDVAEETRVIGPAKASALRKNFDQFISNNGAIQIGLDQGLEAAIAFVDANRTMSPDERRTAINATRNAIKARQAAQDALEEELEARLELTQDSLMSQLYRTVLDRGKPSATINSIDQDIPEFVSLGYLRDDQGEQLQLAIANRRNNPVTEAGKLASEAELNRRLADSYTNPESVTFQDAVQNRRLVPEHQRVLLNAIEGQQDEKHYRNSQAFKRHMSRLTGLRIDLAKVEQFTGQEGLINDEIDRQIASINQQISEAAGPDGFLSEREIEEFMQPRLERIIRDLRERDYPVPTQSATDSLNQLRGQ